MDGAGIFLPGVFPCSCQIRGGWLKGAIFPFDFHRFIEEYRDELSEKHMIDAWGDLVTVDEFLSAKMILTDSQLKMQKYYRSMQEYRECFKKAGLSITINNCAHEPESVVKVAYQPFQTIPRSNLTDKAIELLAEKTIKAINDAKNDPVAALKLMGVELTTGETKNFPPLAAAIVTSLVSLQMATGDDYDTVKNLMKQYNDLGQELGAITTDVASGADAWLRQGKSLEQTNTLLKDSIVLSKVSGLDAEESTQYLTAAMNGYNVAVDNVMGIVDKVSKVDLESATDAGGLMEAMSRVSTMANTAGVSMDKLLGYMASVGEITQQSMPTLGTAFKSIFARMSDIKAQNYELVDDNGTVELLSDVESSLKKVGIDLRKTVTEYNSYSDVLDNLAAKWNTLNKVQQNELTKAFAGTRQQEVFRTLMEHYDRAKKYAEVAENSAGTAEKKFQDNYLSSLEAKTNALKASFESLSSSLVSDDMYSWALDGAKAVTDFAEKTNILKGALAGLATAGSLYAIQQLVLGFGSAVQEFSNLGKAMSMLKTGTNVTSSMSQLLELTQGLSKSQTAIILSSTELNTAQRTAILMNRGLSASEAEAELSTMGLSAAEGTATATTMSLGSAMKGLFATLAANPIFLLTTAVTVGVAAWQSYNQSVEESIQHTKDSTAELQERNQSLDDNIQKVQELRDSLDSGTLTEQEAYNTKSQLLDIQSQLSDSYGEQADGIDLVNGKLDEQIEKMQQLKVEDAKAWLNDSDHEDAYKKANKAMTKDDYESFFGNTPTLSLLGNAPEKADYTNSDVYKDALKRYQNSKSQIEEIQKAAEKAGLKQYTSTSTGQFQLGFENETVTGADEKLNSFLATVKELKRQFEDEGKNTDYFDKRDWHKLLSYSRVLVRRNKRLQIIPLVCKN